MDVIQLHARALDQTARIVEGVASDQRELPTPCTEWNVKTLLNHMIGGNWMYVGVAKGTPPGGAAESAEEDPAAAFRQSAEALNQAWRAPEQLERAYQLPFATLPGHAVLGIHLVEVSIHGWDLAKATGQNAAFDPVVVEAALGIVHAFLSGPRPPGGPFGPAINVSDDLPAVDRLAALLGRQP
jgi:uncharacterized protein (TIGR03086 family)